MRVLFLFLDGVGLGPDDPATNPLARAAMPNLRALLGGGRLIAPDAPRSTPRATLHSIDACLGVEGSPQSGSGQAALLTGRNVPALTGGHYGPWPSRAIVLLLQQGNLFAQTSREGMRAALLNAYPPTYFAAVDSGRRLYSSVPQAVVSAGLSLKTEADLRDGRAMAADFTGRGWHERLGLNGIPLISPREGGERLARLAASHEFSFFEYWLSDYAGHARDMAAACALLEEFDEVLGALLGAWDDGEGLIVLTSDHGNLEDLTVRGHTRNPVPALLIGSPLARATAAEGLSDLTSVAPAILRVLGVGDGKERG